MIEWMTAVETSPVLARMIGQYLMARNSRTMSEILLEVEHDPIETFPIASPGKVSYSGSPPAISPHRNQGLAIRRKSDEIKQK